jgi:hypothetical protein
MIPNGRLGAGLILLFNNGLLNQTAYRRSSVLAIDPVAGRFRWSYSARCFFSSTAGMQQSLPNDNVLIASSQGGRVFEITPDREIVWQWTPPFLPMRPERYPHDHCPQLADLDRAAEQPIPSRRGRPHVDRELHTFAVPGEYVERSVDGISRQIVDPDLECRELVIPPKAMLSLSFGLDSSKLGLGELRASYGFTLKLQGEEQPKLLHEDVVELGSDSHWRRQRIPLPGLAYQRAELCLQVDTEGTIRRQRALRIAMVENPRIHSGDQPRLPRSIRTGTMSPQERKLREKQLKVLGYVQ